MSVQPIVIIGAGGIVANAHLPAYRLAGYNVHGIYDLDVVKARKLASDFSIPTVYESLEEALEKAPADVIFDVAVPGATLPELVARLPHGSKVLMQKPMGENLRDAQKILQTCREKNLIAAVNFQLRYAPFILAARKLISDPRFGAIVDMEINVNVYTPWHLWSFLYDAPRVEILYHSIHYVDLVRSFLGNPFGVYARTVKHPAMADLASVRTNIILNYGEMVRANILTNHAHDFGGSKQQSYIKIEGEGGAIIITMGLLKNYPVGEADRFEYFFTGDDEWQILEIDGSWFPHAFAGSMGQVLDAAAGRIARPDNSVEDSIFTMAAVEAAHISDASGGISPDAIFSSSYP